VLDLYRAAPVDRWRSGALRTRRWKSSLE
jgi:hypothetical protein